MFLQFITVTHQLPAHSLSYICINALKLQLFVHSDVMLIILRLAQSSESVFTLIW